MVLQSDVGYISNLTLYIFWTFIVACFTLGLQLYNIEGAEKQYDTQWLNIIEMTE